MYLNTIKPSKNSKKSPKRVGRGIGSTDGKTCGRGHKGQHARSGGFHKRGFEGGQMPLQRRLPKVGFNKVNPKCNFEVRLGTLNNLQIETIDVDVLKELGLVPKYVSKIKIISNGSLTKKLTIKGIKITKGAGDKVIELGGTVEN